MRLRTFLIGAALLATPGLAADKKKPVVTTTKTVQVGGLPKRTSSSPITSGFSGLDKNGDGYLTRLEFGYNRQSAQAAAEFDRLAYAVQVKPRYALTQRNYWLARDVYRLLD